MGFLLTGREVEDAPLAPQAVEGLGLVVRRAAVRLARGAGAATSSRLKRRLRWTGRTGQ